MMLRINTEANHATGITSEAIGNEKKLINNYTADVVIASADYHFVETQLLPPQLRSYSNAYWDERVLAPGCLLYYIGLKKKLKNITHHSLFFDVDFEKHGTEIYVSKEWPAEPLFYVSATSVSDDNSFARRL